MGILTVTQTRFRAKGQGSYTPDPTATWTGTTAPTTPTYNYRFEIIGNRCFFNIFILGAGAGAALTGLDLPLPADMPTPEWWTGHAATNNNLCPMHCAWMTSDTAQPQDIWTGMIRSQARCLRLDVASGNYKNVFIRGDYPIAT
jgi:hypothetical protein